MCLVIVRDVQLLCSVPGMLLCPYGCNGLHAPLMPVEPIGGIFFVGLDSCQKYKVLKVAN